MFGADHRVGGQQADGEGGEAHQQQGGDQDRLASDLVSQVAANDAADGTGDEADPEGGEGSEGSDDRVAAREERLSEVEGGGGAEADEVVAFDDGAGR